MTDDGTAAISLPGGGSIPLHSAKAATRGHVHHVSKPILGSGTIELGTIKGGTGKGGPNESPREEFPPSERRRPAGCTPGWSEQVCVPKTSDLGPSPFDHGDEGWNPGAD